MKTKNNATDSTIINSAVILVLILLTLLSFQAEAQTQTYGCLDTDALNYSPTAPIEDGSCVYDVVSGNLVHGFNSTALVQLTSPTSNWFIPTKLIVKYRVSGTTTWTKIVFPVTVLPQDSIYAGYVDTLSISMWYFRAKRYNSMGTVIDDGNRYKYTVRLNNLLPLTQYDTKIFLKGDNVVTGANKTAKFNNTITTWWDQSEAPFPTLYLSMLAQANQSNNQMRLSTTNDEPTNEGEVISIHNVNGQLVNENATGVLIYTYSDGSTKKVLR